MTVPSLGLPLAVPTALSSSSPAVPQAPLPAHAARSHRHRPVPRPSHHHPAMLLNGPAPPVPVPSGIHTFLYDNHVCVRKYDLLEYLGQSRSRRLKYLDEKQPPVPKRKYLLQESENLSKLKNCEPRMPNRTSHAVIYHVELSLMFVEKLHGTSQEFQTLLMHPPIELRPETADRQKRVGVSARQRMRNKQAAAEPSNIMLRQSNSAANNGFSQYENSNGYDMYTPIVPMDETAVDPAVMQEQMARLNDLTHDDQFQEEEKTNINDSFKRLEATVNFWGEQIRASKKQRTGDDADYDDHSSLLQPKEPSKQLNGGSPSLTSNGSSHRPAPSTHSAQTFPGTTAGAAAENMDVSGDPAQSFGIISVGGIRPEDFVYVPTDKFFVNVVGAGFNSTCSCFIHEVTPAGEFEYVADTQFLSPEVLLCWLPASAEPKRISVFIRDTVLQRTSNGIDFNYLVRLTGPDCAMPAFSNYDCTNFGPSGPYPPTPSVYPPSAAPGYSSFGQGSMGHPDQMFFNACVAGNLDLAKRCLNAGANVWFTDDSNATGLHWAASQGYDDIVSLIAASPSFSHTETRACLGAAKDVHGNSSLLLAACSASLATVRALIDVVPLELVNEANNDGFTPLHAAACTHNNRMLACLLEHGAKCDAVTKGELQTPLHVAALSGNDLGCRKLIAAGADPLALTADKSTFLHLAAEQGHSSVIPLAVSSRRPASSRLHRAKNEQGKTPIAVAATEGHVSFFIHLFLSVVGVSQKGISKLRVATANFTRFAAPVSRAPAPGLPAQQQQQQYLAQQPQPAVPAGGPPLQHQVSHDDLMYPSLTQDHDMPLPLSSRSPLEVVTVMRSSLAILEKDFVQMAPSGLCYPDKDLLLRAAPQVRDTVRHILGALHLDRSPFGFAAFVAVAALFVEAHPYTHLVQTTQPQLGVKESLDLIREPFVQTVAPGSPPARKEMLNQMDIEGFLLRTMSVVLNESKSASRAVSKSYDERVGGWPLPNWADALVEMLRPKK